MRKTFLIIYLIVVSNIVFAQVETPAGSTFWDFLNLYSSSKCDTCEKDINVERRARLYAHKLTPDGACSRMVNAMIDYAANYEQYLNDNYEPNWTELGTTGSSDINTCNNGRIHSIAFDPNYDGVTNKTIYAASSHGGLWRSENDGMNWETVNTDIGIPITSVSDIVIDHGNSNNIL